MIFEVKGLCFGYKSHIILKKLTFNISEGDFFSIVGPNGSGKSTLLRLLSGFVKPSSGSIKFKEKDLYAFNPLELAKIRAFVTQDNIINFPYTCREVVMMGRFPFLGNFRSEGKEDINIVDSVMKRTCTDEIAHRPVTDISGGERQRVMIAQALAQNPEVLLLDEPTSSLDINYQIDILDYFKTLNLKEKVTVILVIHDLNLACRYSDRLLLLNKGSVHSCGSPGEVITEKNIEEVFSMKVKIEEDPIKPVPRIYLLSKVVQDS